MDEDPITNLATATEEVTISEETTNAEEVRNNYPAQETTEDPAREASLAPNASQPVRDEDYTLSDGTRTLMSKKALENIFPDIIQEFVSDFSVTRGALVRSQVVIEIYIDCLPSE